MREAVEFQRLLHMGQQRGQQLALALGAMRIRAGAKQREPARVKSGRVHHPADEEVRLLKAPAVVARSEEHTSELQSPCNLVCRLLLEKKKKRYSIYAPDIIMRTRSNTHAYLSESSM